MNTRDPAPEERAQAEAALEQAIALCQRLLDADPAQRKLLIEQQFRTRVSDPAMAGFVQHYAGIAAALKALRGRPEAFVLDEQPEHPDHIAYVYCDEPQRVYLHPRFFEQDRIRMARTLVHQASHWDGARDDPPACRELAYTLHRDNANAFGRVVEQLAREPGAA
jgi:hypothetical protein